MAGSAVLSLDMSTKMCLLPMSHRVQALYAENLPKNQDITVEQLETLFPKKMNVKKGPFNLSEVTYFEDFMADPAEVNAATKAKREKAESSMSREEFYQIMRSPKHHELRKHRQFDFRLNEKELEKLKENGLVVSDRFQVDSFAEGYYRTYTDDLPVYITADSILHAWHRSYDSILQKLERESLKPAVEQMTFALVNKIHELREQNKGLATGKGFLKCLDELEFFLGVGAELLMQVRDETNSEMKAKTFDFYEIRMRQMRETQEASQIGKPELSSVVMKKVMEAMDWIENEKLTEVQLFGRARKVDFSLFKPRGHYTTSKSLMNYFQAMIWFGTIDFRVAGRDSSELELKCSVIFGQIIKQANMYETWLEIDSLLTLLVGEPDSMTLKHLFQLIGDADLSAYCSSLPSNDSIIATLKNRIVSSDVARQAICGHPFVADEKSTEPTELPLSFTYFGQRFSIDSYVLSKVVFDNVKYQGMKLPRRIPSGIDVAFTVFQNDVPLPIISKRITRQGDATEHVQFRDGYEYSSNLAALRSTVDQLEPEYMSSSIVARWLDVIRQLSKSASHFSWTCHSSEWHRKQLATQLASWTQLRHDNMLYIKQGITMRTMCEYPAGFVDPYPEFWHKMKELAEAAGSQLQGSGIIKSPWDQSHYSRFFTEFAKIMKSLEGISKKQAAHEKLTEEETNMLKSVMEERHGSGGSRYLGWYPKLFYNEPEESGKADYLVADLHTDLPDFESGDPGSILNAGVGNVLTAFIVVESEDGSSSMFAGPVYSYYEFTTAINQRLTDKEWTDMVRKKQLPSPPTWATDSYLLANRSES